MNEKMMQELSDDMIANVIGGVNAPADASGSKKVCPRCGAELTEKTITDDFGGGAMTVWYCPKCRISFENI